MADDDAPASFAKELPRSRRRSLTVPFFAVIGPIGAAAVASAAALSAALLDVAVAQTIGNTAENCADCAPSRPASGTSGGPQLPDIRGRFLTADDMRRLMGMNPEGRSFTIVNGSGIDLAALGGEEALLDAYDYVVARAGAALDRSISLQISARDTSRCPVRGAANWSPRAPTVMLYLAASSDRTEALGILAHELGHIVHVLGFPSGGLTGNGGFDQGFATWAAGRYWTDMLGFGSFAAAVASYRAAGTYMALGSFPDDAFPSSPSADDGFPSAEDAPPPDNEAGAAAACLAKRDIWYTEWAAFIDYLDERFGRERLLMLLRTNVNNAPAGWRPGELAFGAVYGTTFEALESEWLEAVDTHGAESVSTAGPEAAQYPASSR